MTSKAFTIRVKFGVSVVMQTPGNGASWERAKSSFSHFFLSTRTVSSIGATKNRQLDRRGWRALLSRLESVIGEGFVNCVQFHSIKLFLCFIFFLSGDHSQRKYQQFCRDMFRLFGSIVTGLRGIFLALLRRVGLVHICTQGSLDDTVNNIRPGSEGSNMILFTLRGTM